MFYNEGEEPAASSDVVADETPATPADEAPATEEAPASTEDAAV